MKIVQTLGIALLMLGNSMVSAIPQLPQQQEPEQQQSEITTPSAPRRLEISVSVADPEDLKVFEGQEIETGQTISDRTRQRQRLQQQQQRLQLGIERLESLSISRPSEPGQPPPLAKLPPPNYLEREAAIARAESRVQSIGVEVNQKFREIKELSGLQLSTETLEHEQAKLDRLLSAEIEAQRELGLAIAQLEQARTEYQRQEYEHQLKQAEQLERQERNWLQYQGQLQSWEQARRDREFQIQQLEQRLSDVEVQLSELAVVRSPYPGEIRRIRWTGQNPDGSLSVELSLMVNDGDGDGE